ncbi:MAG: hypothetical protein NTX97_01580 [Bacteroidetes bacterium]|nr:hypothetical protein [Bacteroidota bacterium]
MIKTVENDHKEIEAVIYLKNGKRKYGKLINDVINDAYHFISNTNYREFIRNRDQVYIEIFPIFSIETIDTDLK